MPEPREATTEQLSYVIHAMLLARQTGMLRVERNYGSATEGGAVVFVNGQIVQASSGPFRGIEALNRLSEWGLCRFVFIPTSVAELTQMQHRLPASTSSSAPTPPTPPPPITTLPPRNTPPPIHHPANNGYRSETGPLSTVTRPLPAVSVTRKLPVVTTQLPAIKTPAPAPTALFHRLQEGPTALNYIEQIKLSRVHRRLFLLIDGKRSIPDLAHLMGKPPEEIYPLLSDMERAGLIQRTEPR